MMFAFLAYSGTEPDWAAALRQSDFPGLTVYSEGRTLESQLEAIRGDLEARAPNMLAYGHSQALRLEKEI